MRSTVVEVGPVTVRGPGRVAADLAVAAVAGIDDEIVLVDDEPVAAAELWTDVLTAAAADAAKVTLVCPTWWTADRCDRVRAAVADAEVIVMQRVQVVSRSLTGLSWVVVEISDGIVMVSAADGESVALARHIDSAGVDADIDPETVVRAVIAAAGGSAEVLVDAPSEVAAAATLGGAVLLGLRRRGIPAAMAGIDLWCEAPHAPDVDIPRPAGRWWGRVTLGAAVVAAVGMGGIAVADGGSPGGQPVMTVLVEGRVGMQIPVGWAVRRVTEGSGSARVQVVSSSDTQVMVHLTQSGTGDGDLADTLYRALEEQPEGVFVEFDRSAVVAGRPVVSYREIRPGREIRWAVFVDGAVRIAVGCQSAPGQAEAVQPACDAAVRSAHAVF